MSSPASPATSEPLPKSLSEHAYDLFVRRGILAGSTRWTESTLHQLADTIEALAYAYIREQTKSNGSNSTNSDPLPAPPTPDPFDAKLAENVAKHETDRKPTSEPSKPSTVPPLSSPASTHHRGKLTICHEDLLTITQRRIVEVGARLIDTLLRKNTDYGNSAHTPPLLAPDCTPEQGLRVRMSDKLMRITQLVQRPAQVADEAIEDTILDVAGYCLLYLTLPKPEGQNPPKEKEKTPTPLTDSSRTYVCAACRREIVPTSSPTAFTSVTRNGVVRCAPCHNRIFADHIPTDMSPPYPLPRWWNRHNLEEGVSYTTPEEVAAEFNYPLSKEKLAKLRERYGELKTESAENAKKIGGLLDEAKETSEGLAAIETLRKGLAASGICEIPSKYLTTHDITKVSREQVQQELDEIKQREAENLRRQELARAVARSVSPSRSYAECTGRTEEQVAADAEKARTYNPASDHTKPLPPRWVQPVPAPGEFD
jgi:DNA-directed RNA polymerase subunit RPC12/RpoP